MIFQKWKLDFSITKPCRYELEAPVFNHYIVPTPSTVLEIIPSLKKEIVYFGQKILENTAISFSSAHCTASKDTNVEKKSIGNCRRFAAMPKTEVKNCMKLQFYLLAN